MSTLKKDERGIVFITVALLLSGWLLLWGSLVDGAINRSAATEIKHGINRAAKAAALQVDEIALAAGRYEIHSTESRKAFETYLRSNLILAPDLTPLQGSPLSSAPTIDSFQIYNGPTFPHTLQFAATAEHPSLSYTFTDPGIAIVLTTALPRFFTPGVQQVVLVGAAEVVRP